MNVSKHELIGALRAAHQEAGVPLGEEVTDEMAVPSYLQGGRLSRYVFWRKLEHVINAARLAPNTSVFDFGCGTGILLPRLAANGRSVLATDLYPEIARNLANRLGLQGVQFVPADRWQRMIPEGRVETIIAANVLEHVQDRREIIAAFLRKLTPAGRLVICGPTENLTYRFGRWMVGFSGHYHVTTVHRVVADARAAGAKQVHLKSFPLPGPLCLYKIAVFTRPQAVSATTHFRPAWSDRYRPFPWHAGAGKPVRTDPKTSIIG